MMCAEVVQGGHAAVGGAGISVRQHDLEAWRRDRQ